MKKLLLLAVSAVLAANMSAEQANQEKQINRNREQLKQARIERDIKMLSEQLYLSAEQETQFANTYREYKKEQAKLHRQKMKLDRRFKQKFSKSLNERQLKRLFPDRKKLCRKTKRTEIVRE